MNRKDGPFEWLMAGIVALALVWFVIWALVQLVT